MVEKTEERFRHIREKDKGALVKLLSELEKSGFQSELRGSATYKSDYSDIDLNVWDAQKQGPGYKFGGKAMDIFLGFLGAEKIDFSQPYMTSWVEGRWYFNFNETKFDIIYTPRGSSLAGYGELAPPKNKKYKVFGFYLE